RTNPHPPSLHDALPICKRIPWVQANLILTEQDDRNVIRSWQQRLKAAGVWVSEPVPMFPYPGTPMYQEIFGPIDDRAWERAHYRSEEHTSELQSPDHLV